MRTILSRTLLVTALAALTAGCGTSDEEEEVPLFDESCTVEVEADVSGQALQEKVQTALIEATAGSTICFAPGTYAFTGMLSTNVRELTIKGVGKSPRDVIFDFQHQETGDKVLHATGDDFTLENLSIANARGNGVVVEGAKNVTYRKIHAWWDAGSNPENGAYVIFPIRSEQIVVEDCDISNSSDAGIYVGQSHTVILRNNHLHENVDAFSIENSSDVEIYDNHAHDNTGGIVIFNLPELDVQNGRRILVRDNVFEDNNGENFGDPNAIVGIVPPGTGVIILAADNVELRNNVFRNNKTASLMIGSYNTVELLDSRHGSTDPEHDRYPESIFITNNTFDHNGYEPDAQFFAMIKAVIGAGASELTTIEDLLWDGDLDLDNPDKSDNDRRVCFDDNVRADGSPATFRNLGLPTGESATTELGANDCELPPLASITG